MAGLPVGAAFGSLVHAVLEHADPAAADFRAELLGHIDDQLGWWPVELDREELADALVAVSDSPLGPLVGASLRQIPLADRLREMDFELPAGRRRRARRARRRTPRRPGAAARAAPARGRPGAALRRGAARSARRADAARLPHRLGRRGAPSARAALPDRRLQDQLARPDRRAAHRARLPSRGARRGDGPLRLPAAGAALRRGAAPLPALAPARLRPGAAPRRGALPLPPRHVRPRHPAGRRCAVRGLRLAAAGRPGRGAVRPARRRVPAGASR